MTPFATGYTEALRASLPEEHRDAPLADATLARIIADCERFSDLLQWDYTADQRKRMGRDFWRGRNGESAVNIFAEFGGFRKLVERARSFSPARPFLNDTGHVCLREGDRS